MPPLCNRLGRKISTRRVDSVGGILPKRDERCVSDKDPACRDFVLALSDAQEHLDPLLPWCAEISMCGQGIVWVALHLPSDLGYHGIERYLIPLNRSQLKVSPFCRAIPCGRQLWLRKRVAEAKQLRQRAGPENRFQRAAFGLDADQDAIARRKLRDIPRFRLNHLAVDGYADRCCVARLEARHVGAQPGRHAHAIAGFVTLSRLCRKLARVNLDRHGISLGSRCVRSRLCGASGSRISG
ncbi:hypothetical protein D9M69_360340 [compost metagenome]